MEVTVLAVRSPIWISAAAWTLCIVLAVAALVLGPLYLVHEAGAVKSGGYFEISRGWSREILALVHVVFVLGMFAAAMSSVGRAVVGRMAGVSVALGVWEILLSVSALALSESGRYAPPNMTVAALGALLLLGGIGLSLDEVSRKLVSPKTPVVLIFGAAVLIGTIAFGLIGWLNVRHYERVDYTRAGRYSLPPATVNLLKRLEDEVRITTLFVVRDLADDTLRRETQDILEEYARISPLIKVNHIDLRRDVKATKELEKRLAVRNVRPERNAVVFECPRTGRVMKVAGYEIIQAIKPARPAQGLGHAGKMEAEEEAQPEFRFLGDTVFHQALSVVTSRKPRKLYFVVGHGEKPEALGPPSLGRISSQDFKQLSEILSHGYLESSLRRQYWRIQTLDLEKTGNVPDDCDVLVIAGPWQDFAVGSRGPAGIPPFSQKHADLVRTYLEGGGRALIMIDPVGARYGRMIAPLLALLADYGVGVDIDRYIVDTVRQYTIDQYGRLNSTEEWRPLFTVSPFEDYGNGSAPAAYHPAVNALARSEIAVLLCAPLGLAPVPGLRQTRLLASSDKTRVGRIPAPGESYVPPDEAISDSRAIAVAVEKEDARPVMGVLGSSNLFIKYIIRFRTGAALGVANEEFAQKILAWLAGSAEELAVTPRATEAAYGMAEPGDIRAVRFVSVLVIPSIFILIGAVVWLGRRK